MCTLIAKLLVETLLGVLLLWTIFDIFVMGVCMRMAKGVCNADNNFLIHLKSF